jgi:CubicO group peptidase (beta-lactamase class C family)
MREYPAAQRVLEDAIASRVFPGAVVEIGSGERPLATLTAGRLTYDASARPAARDTVYDLASLTKVLATTTLALLLVDRGRLALDDRVERWVPAWTGPDRRNVTVRQLLTHASGLPAHRRYFESLQGRSAFQHAISQEPLEYEPGSASVYSDAGFMLLGFVVEAAGEASLAAQFDRWRRAEVPAADTVGFLPPAAWRERTAPTENDPWRGRVLVGEVHDENAAALGGVAGHAGLFGTAASVGSLGRWWLRRVRADDATSEPPARLDVLARTFVQAGDVPGSSRALGWDTMRTSSSCGTRLSSGAFGHTGFTGTSLWIDPHAAGRGSGLYVAFLSNRVHPTREGESIQEARRALHDAVMTDLDRS